MSVRRVTILSTVQCLFSASARGVARHGLGVLKPSQYQTPLKHPYPQMKACPLNEWASVLAAGILITPATVKSEDLLSYTHTHTHTHPFNGPFSGTTQVSRYQKGKTNMDFTEARDSEWQWHQMGHMQVYTSLQTDNHASTPPLSFFTGRIPFLPPNQQPQSTEGCCCLMQFELFSLTVKTNKGEI